MEKVKNETIVEHLNWRYATKAFDTTKKISATDWETLEESLRLAPSSFGLQPWKFVVVQNPAVRKQLTPASYNQVQVEQCSHFVVVTHLKTVTEDTIHHYIQAIAKTRGISEADLKGYSDIMIGSAVKGPMAANIKNWTARQPYIAMGMFMTTAALLQIDVCPMEGIDNARYDEILGLDKTPYTAISVMAAGYRSPGDPMQNMKKVRFAKSEVIQTIS